MKIRDKYLHEWIEQLLLQIIILIFSKIFYGDFWNLVVRAFMLYTAFRIMSVV